MTLAVTVTGTAAARAGAVLAWIAAGRHTKSQLRRVASAVGEGAATIPLVHRYLQTSPAAPALRAGYPPHGPAHSAASTHPTTPPAVPHESAAAPKERAAALP